MDFSGYSQESVDRARAAAVAVTERAGLTSDCPEYDQAVDLYTAHLLGVPIVTGKAVGDVSYTGAASAQSWSDSWKTLIASKRGSRGRFACCH